MNIQDVLTIIDCDCSLNEYADKIIQLVKENRDNLDMVLLKQNTIWTKDEMMKITDCYNRYMGVTLSFIDKKFMQQYDNGLMSFLDTLALIRAKGRYTKTSRNTDFLKQNNSEVICLA